MRKYATPLVILLALLVIFGAALLVFGLKGVVLDPKGEIGIQQRNLIVLVTLLMLIVIIPVFLLTLVISARYRGKQTPYTPDRDHHLLGELLWWAIPFGVITVIGIFAWIGTHHLDPYRPIRTGTPPMTIQVVALDWKWLFIYPEQGIATVNYLQIPEKTPISFEITADAPMNSFWIPQLGGQIYAMPAMRSRLHLIANEVGDYWGRSANLSGEGFAGMIFAVKATSQADFNKWVEEVKKSPQRLDSKEFQQLAEPSSYNPVALYASVETGLFEKIVNMYGSHH